MAYTLRLDDKQEKHLKKIMGTLHINTANKAFVELLERFEADQKELAQLRKQCRELDNRLYDLQKLYRNKAQIEKELDDAFNFLPLE